MLQIWGCLFVPVPAWHLIVFKISFLVFEHFPFLDQVLFLLRGAKIDVDVVTYSNQSQFAELSKKINLI